MTSGCLTTMGRRKDKTPAKRSGRISLTRYSLTFWEATAAGRHEERADLHKILTRTASFFKTCHRVKHPRHSNGASKPRCARQSRLSFQFARSGRRVFRQRSADSPPYLRRSDRKRPAEIVIAKMRRRCRTRWLNGPTKTLQLGRRLSRRINQAITGER